MEPEKYKRWHVKICTNEKPGRSNRPALIVLPPVEYLTI